MQSLKQARPGHSHQECNVDPSFSVDRAVSSMEKTSHDSNTRACSSRHHFLPIISIEVRMCLSLSYPSHRILCMSALMSRKELKRARMVASWYTDKDAYFGSYKTKISRVSGQPRELGRLARVRYCCHRILLFTTYLRL